MPRSLRYCLIVLALAALAFVAWNGLSPASPIAEEGAAPSVVAHQLAVKSAATLEADDAPGEHVETTSTTRTEVANEAAVASPRERTDIKFAKLTARFVDSLGNSLPGVFVLDAGRKTVSTTSDAAGRIALDVPQFRSESSWSARFEARRKGYATKFLAFALTLDTTTPLGDVVLAPGVDVHGRTVDDTGVGIEATVGKDATRPDMADPVRRLQAEQRCLGSRPTTRSDSNGNFVLEGLPLGELHLWAKGEATHMAWSERLALVEGQDLHDVLVTVPRPRDDELITGSVLLPSGQPAARAFVSCGYVDGQRQGSQGTWAGNDGRFQLLIEPGYSAYELTATDRDERYPSVVLRDVRPGDRNLELRLFEQPPLFIAVHGPLGEPIDRCSMRVHRAAGPNSWVVVKANPKSIGGGLHETVVPNTRFRIQVEAEGFQLHKTDELEPPEPGSTLEIRLERVRHLRGRVFAEGRAAAGAKVSSYKSVGESVLRVNGFRSLHTPIEAAKAIAKEDGTFELPYEGEDSLWIRAELAGFAAAELEPIDPASSGALTLELVRGGVIEGVVILPNGVDAEGTIVGISRCDGFPRTQRAGAGGRFHFENLTPGPWQVMRRETEFDRMSLSTSTSNGPGAPIEWSCEVSDGRTTRFDLDLSRP
ncbi:MAG: hypothetical protein HUU28_00950 [Planctomycetaceae bacterium]|nr:hypothetical protein [Planctomycetaceae bacterium]